MHTIKKGKDMSYLILPIGKFVARENDVCKLLKKNLKKHCKHRWGLSHRLYNKNYCTNFK